MRVIQRLWRVYSGLHSSVTKLTQIEQIQVVLAQLQPYIASHGGAVELVRVENNVVYIKFQGACVQCPLSFYTVTYGIERQIKAQISSIQSVQVIEDTL